MNNSLLDLLLDCQQQVQHSCYTAYSMITIRSLPDDIPTFDGKPKLYFGSILKLENLATETT